MKILVEILKGILIGVANVIPGLSGGTIAIAMGIYEKIIYVINNIFKEPIKCIKEMWTYIVGMVLGVAISVFGIVYLFNVAPVPTSMLFVGLIIGSLPTIKEKLGTDKLKIVDYIVFTLLAMLIIFMPIFATETTTVISTSVKDLIIMFFMGVLASATMIIPGVSGSMMLMIFGYYTSIMSTISECIKLLMTFKIGECFSTALPIIPFALGIVIGIFLMAKLIDILLKKHHTVVYWGIMGLIVASPFPIILQLDMYNISIWQAILSILLLAGGIYATKLLSKIDEESEEK